jgi:asparagine synthase (glutamine-hydrolysing)
MCGFIGRITRTLPPAEPIEHAASALHRRGPDGWRTWRSPCGRVELLHARLAIVDPDARAMQPFVSRDGRHVLAFNGEVYNYLDLRRDLGGLGFATDSDTEVLLAGLAQEGLRFLDDIRGMASGVWVDLGEARVHLFRDPVGKKPLLVWHDVDGSVLFGSSLRALHSVRSEPGTLREQALRDVLAQGYIEPPHGLFDGVSHVEPGTVLTFDFNGRLVERRRITPRIHPLEPPERTDAKGTLGRLLEQAVARRLENNLTPAALFSGGIDSTVVAMIADRLALSRGVRLQVYSLRPFIPGTNDEPHAREAARRLGLDIEWVSLPLRHVADRLLRAIDALDEPLAMVSFFHLFELVRAVGSRSRVLLTGDGGDEVFCGYGRPDDWSRRPHEGAAGPVVGTEPPAWFGGWARRCVSGDLLGHGFQKVDRASAEQGVEIRCPLLDLDLLAYARSLPPERLFRGGRTKAPLKDQFVGWPVRFLDRRKVGMTYNLRWQWLLGNFAGLREGVDRAIVDALAPQLPSALRGNPMRWSATGIHHHFQSAYSLLVMSRGIRNLAAREGRGAARAAG